MYSLLPMCTLYYFDDSNICTSIHELAKKRARKPSQTAFYLVSQ